MLLDQVISKAKRFSNRGNIEEAKILLQGVSKKYPENKRLLLLLNSLENNNYQHKIYKQLSQEEINKIDSLFNNGHLDKAYSLSNHLIKYYPNSPFLNNMIGAILEDKKELNTSLKFYEKALENLPNSPEIYYNIANVFKKLKKPIETISYYEKAIALKPNFSLAYNNLGSVYQTNINIDKNFGIDYIIKAINCNPNEKKFYANLAVSLNLSNEIIFSENLEKIILNLSKFVNLRSSEESSILSKFLINSPSFQKIYNLLAKDALESSFDEVINIVNNNKILFKLLTLGPITRTKIEFVLERIRYLFLKKIEKNNFKKSYFNFVYQLALHCFDNEYLYSVSNLEKNILDNLEKKLYKNLDSFELKINKLVVLSSYRLINKEIFLDNINKIKDLGLYELYKKFILDISLENDISKTIKTISNVRNNVSKKVKQQYEENPYPRWNKNKFFNNEPSIKKYLDRINIHPNNMEKDENLEILIAGCGTGQHVIEEALKFKKSNLVAIDLSLKSLSFAIRKTNEIGIKNIEYFQGDILDLGKLDKKFDLIESSGVLHHMEKPFEGWKTLSESLNVNGIMLIGLYSDIARRDIKKAREIIKEKGLKENACDIKKFRKYITSYQVNKEIINIPRSADFFSLSACRDLLFHSQEHRYTIPRIKKEIKKLGLKFLGFQHPNNTIISKFNDIYIDEKAYLNLDYWEEFENNYSDTFSTMYQFWVQKEFS